MNTSTINDFAQEVCQAPYGLIIIAGPKKSGRTTTMRLLESTVSKMNRGRYFRIGDTPPEDDSIVRFIETFKPAFESLDELTDDEVKSEYRRYVTWERKVKFGIFPMEPGGVFIDDLGELPAGLSTIAIDLALTGTLAIVSIEADNAKEAVQFISGAARTDSGPNSLLVSALHAIVVQKPSLDPVTGEQGIELEFPKLDAEFWETI